MERKETMRIQKERYNEKRKADNQNLMKEIELQEKINQEDVSMKKSKRILLENSSFLEAQSQRDQAKRTARLYS